MTDVMDLYLARARQDPQFRLLLRSQPRRVLRGKGLTREEVQRLLEAVGVEPTHRPRISALTEARALVGAAG